MRRPIESGVIVCPKCSQEKSLDQFYKRSSGKIESWCKECIKKRDSARSEDPDFRALKRRMSKEWAQNNPDRVRARNLQKFNLTLEQYEEIERSQLGVCAICDGPPGRRALHVDHDHSCCEGNYSCGECIRGLLCVNCNHLLGKAKDDPAVLERAAEYLRKSS